MVTQKYGWKLLVASLVISIALIRVAEANSDIDALTAFRESLSDPANVLGSWDPDLVDACTYIYITCNQDDQVTRVDLGGQNLSGHLVPELGTLDNLQYLELYGNNIQGTIPAELGNMKSLLSLGLYDNKLSGNIPPSLGNLNSLRFLRLQDNQLTGRVPDEIKRLPNLVILNVTGNPLSG